MLSLSLNICTVVWVGLGRSPPNLYFYPTILRYIHMYLLLRQYMCVKCSRCETEFYCPTNTISLGQGLVHPWKAQECQVNFHYVANCRCCWWLNVIGVVYRGKFPKVESLRSMRKHRLRNTWMMKSTTFAVTSAFVSGWNYENRTYIHNRHLPGSRTTSQGESIRDSKSCFEEILSKWWWIWFERRYDRTTSCSITNKIRPIRCWIQSDSNSHSHV